MHFIISGTLADLDETIEGEPYHPTKVLLVDLSDAFARVIAPEAIVQAYRDLLCAGRPIEIVGTVEAAEGALTYIASSIRLTGFVH